MLMFIFVLSVHLNGLVLKTWERAFSLTFYSAVRAVICCFELQMSNLGQCEVWMKFSIAVTRECAVVLVIVPANTEYMAHTCLPWQAVSHSRNNHVPEGWHHKNDVNSTVNKSVSKSVILHFFFPSVCVQYDWTQYYRECNSFFLL